MLAFYLFFVGITFTLLAIVWRSGDFINLAIKAYLIMLTIASWALFIKKIAPSIVF